MVRPPSAICLHWQNGVTRKSSSAHFQTERIGEAVLSSIRPPLELEQSLSMLTVISGAGFCSNYTLFRGPPTFQIFQ